MSVSSEFMSKKPASSPEKPRFKKTCNLLSQYLKENGSFGDLSLGMTCNLEANGNSEIIRPTRTSFPNQISGNVCAGAPMDLFPQRAGFSTPAPTDDGPKMVDSSVTSTNKCAATEPRTTPMTIFYGGRVIVLNDFPADKANEIMLLATEYGSENRKTNAPVTSSVPGSPRESVNGAPPTSNSVTSHGCAQPAKRPADLPIARRASLHRFLEKRKDRITSKAPYQINNSTAPSHPKAGNSKPCPWLGLAVEPLQ